MKTTWLNRSFLILIFLSLIVGFITFALLAKTLPLIAANTLYFCQQFITNTLLTIPKSLPKTVAFALSASLLLGTLSFLIQLAKTRKLIRGLLTKQIVTPARVQPVIVSLGLSSKVYVIKDDTPFSFCFGILLPHIIISTGLVNRLSGKELEAVFLHEQAHLHAHDPFKIILGKTIASTFFFLPIFSELNNIMNTNNEILADKFVTTTQRETAHLRSALRKIIGCESKVRFATVPAISHPDHLETRVRQLVDPTLALGFSISSKGIFTGLAFIVASWFFLQTPVSAFQTDPQLEISMEPSYFLCSTDNACQQQCYRRAQTSTISTPEELFIPTSPLTRTKRTYYNE